MTSGREKGSSLIALAASMATRDWLHEIVLSLCGVLALASILAPMLVLHGAHMGVVERMRENLLKDPTVLVLVPQGSSGAGYAPDFIKRIGELPGMRYAIGRTRDVAAELQVSLGEKRLTITLDATSKGDPLIDNFDQNAPRSAPGQLEIALTASAANKLGVKAGDKIQSSLVRRSASGRMERLQLEFTVASVLPQLASGRDAGLVDMRTLLAIQDYRDNIPSDLLGSSGIHPVPAERRYESFRAYANGLDAIEGLQAWFNDHNTPVNTRAKDIASIRKIDSTLGAVIMLIAGAGCAGFFAFMMSAAEASVRRKWKQMGMLRLTGFSRSAILVFPLTQALLTGIAGCLFAFALYAIVAYSIDFMFASETGGESICVISVSFMILTFAAVQGLALLASGRAAWKAASISPSTVIREI